MAWLDVRYVPQYLHLGCSGAMYKSANIPFHKIYFLDNENIVLKTYIFTLRNLFTFKWMWSYLYHRNINSLFENKNPLNHITLLRVIWTKMQCFTLGISNLLNVNLQKVVYEVMARCELHIQYFFIIFVFSK